MSLKVLAVQQTENSLVSGFENRLSGFARNISDVGDVLVERASIPATEDTMPQKQTRRRATVLGWTIGALLALLATGVARAQEFTEEFHQQYPLAANGSVTLKNLNGWIHVTAWDQNQVKVDAVKRARTKQRLDEARITVENEANSIYIQTRYPERNNYGGCDGDDDCHNSLANVDYTITVPRNARLERINPVNGSVEISGVKGPVHVEAVNGRVTVTGLANDADVSSVNGTVEATFDRVTGSSRVHAVNGRVSVTVPSDASLRVRAHSLNGSIDNDFGLPESRGRFIGHDLDGKLGQGDASLEVNTVNGHVAIRHANDGKPMATVTSMLPKERTLAPY
jgi:hypothetical protein